MNFAGPAQCGSGRGSQRLAWYTYDWANSPFSTSVLAVFFGPYLTGIAQSALAPSTTFAIGDVRIPTGSIFPYLVSLSLLLRLFAIPYLSAIADASQANKTMLGVFAYLGSAATAAMYWLDGDRLGLGSFLFLIANVSWGLSLVFYNALLPQVATREEKDSVSCRGAAVGYLAGGLVLAAHLMLLRSAGALGLTDMHAVRISLSSSGIWWACFSTASLLGIRSRDTLSQGAADNRPKCSKPAALIKRLREHPQTLRFLIAHTLYEVGLETVIIVSALFGHEELHLPFETLTVAILIVQFVGTLGPLVFGWAAKAFGARRAVLASLVCWVGVLLYAYALAFTATDFMIMASGIALAIGGTQALSRGLLAGMIPPGQEATFFGARDMAVAAVSWIGPISFGASLQMTGSYRSAILSLVVYFVLGAAVLMSVDVNRATA